jgi:hypothetical protein
MAPKRGQMEMAGLIGWLLSAALLGIETGKAAATKPIALGKGPHLLLDDYLIEKSSGLERTIHPPRRERAGPVVTSTKDGNWQPYLTVLRDPKSKRFRIWYDAFVKGRTHLGYLESRDGIHWERPHRILADPAPIIFGASILDEGPGFADPDRRYRLVWWNRGMWLAHSADGLRWQASRKGPVLRGINDILCLNWDPLRKRYLAIFGMPSRKEDGYKGRTPNAPEGYRRCVGQSVSKDALHWSKPRRIFKPEPRDVGITEFYSVGGVLARGDLLVGLLKVLRDDLPADPKGKVAGIGYTVLVWSRDGETWQRDRQPFFDRNHDKGTWDHAMVWVDCQLPVGDEVFLYYGGYARGHKVERFTERQIGQVCIRRDRYVSRQAGKAGGTLRTRLVTLDGKALALNVDASKGKVLVQVVGPDDKPLPGMSYADCAPIIGDHLGVPVRWKQPVAALRGKPVRLEFSLRQAHLFAFALE